MIPMTQVFRALIAPGAANTTNAPLCIASMCATPQHQRLSDEELVFTYDPSETDRMGK